MRRVVTAIAALGVVASLRRLFRKRFSRPSRLQRPTASAKAKASAACRSRRGDVLPSHAALPDVPANGQLLGGGRLEGLCQADQGRQGRVPLHRLPGREERGADQGLQGQRPHADRCQGRRQQGQRVQEPDGDMDEGRRQRRRSSSTSQSNVKEYQKSQSESRSAAGRSVHGCLSALRRGGPLSGRADVDQSLPAGDQHRGDLLRRPQGGRSALGDGRRAALHPGAVPALPRPGRAAGNHGDVDSRRVAVSAEVHAPGARRRSSCCWACSWWG